MRYYSTLFGCLFLDPVKKFWIPHFDRQRDDAGAVITVHILDRGAQVLKELGPGFKDDCHFLRLFQLALPPIDGLMWLHDIGAGGQMPFNNHFCDFLRLSFIRTGDINK